MKRLDPDGYRLVVLFLGWPWTIWAAMSPFCCTAVSCLLAILYLDFRAFAAYVGLRRIMLSRHARRQK